MTPQGPIQVRRSGRRTDVTWSRPPVNVFDTATLTALAEALRSPAVDEASLVVLSGAGRGWSAGFDVGDHLPPRLSGMLDAFDDALRALWDVSVPTLARVHGPCLGGGLELAMAADLVWASRSATFGQPEVRLGVFAPFGAAYYPEALGSRAAAEVLFLGANMTADEAQRMGIVNRVVADEGLDAAVDRTAQTLTGYPRSVLVEQKKALRAAVPSPWPALVAARRIYEDELMAGPDAEEGLRAFLEKRPPRWSSDKVGLPAARSVE